MKAVLFSALLVSPLAAALPPGVWPQWRGDGTGVSAETSLPTSWSETENVLWRQKIAGYGWSNPVVAKGRVFLTTAEFEGQQTPVQKGPPTGEPPPQTQVQRKALCLDAATGKLLWERVVDKSIPEQGNHPSNTWATETPVTDGENVYFVFGNVGVFCFDFEGQAQWEHRLQPVKVFGNWGTSSSPVLDSGRLFLVCDNNERSYLLALDAKSGKIAWREERQERSTWSTPLVWRNVQRTELVVMGSSRIRGYEPKNGRELWRLASENNLGGGRENDGRGKGPTRTRALPDVQAHPPGPGSDGASKPKGKAKSGGCKASPTATSELLFVGMSTRKTEGELGPMWAVKAGASGDISLREGQTSSKDIAWFREDAGPHFTSPLVYRGLLYVFTGQQGHPLNVFDAATGETVYQAPLGKTRSNMGSPIAWDGKVVCVDTEGTAFVIQAGREFKLLETNAVDAMTWASPAPAEGHLYLRTASSLFCFGK